MDRRDLAKARAALPNLEPIWQHRRVALEGERDQVVMKLDQHLDESPKKAAEPQMADVYRKLIRLDRSLWFLDRALMHLDDMDHKTQYAERIPLDLRPERNT